MEKERALNIKDDLIRALKEKLESAPEDIMVPAAELDVAHAQTKAELAAIKEKCKKLIVKVGKYSIFIYCLV